MERDGGPGEGFAIMRHTTGAPHAAGLLVLGLLAWGGAPAGGQDVPARTSPRGGDDREVRRPPGSLPGDGLLFNGWGVTPAGIPVRTSDMILKMMVAPDKK